MQRKFRATLITDFGSDSQLFQLYGKQSINPLRYSMDMMGHQFAGKDYFLEREGYHTYLLNYTVQGEGRIAYEGREFPCSAGDLLFLDCDRLHRVQTEGGWEFWFLHCTGPAMPALYGEFTRVTGNVLHGFRPKRFLEGLKALRKGLLAHPSLAMPLPAGLDERLFSAFSEEIYGMLNDIWLQCVERHGVNSGIPESVLRAQNFLEENFTRRITLAEAAAEAFVSPCRLAHLFKRYTGTTVGGMIASLRLQRATELLATTDEKVISIAVSCGFTDAQMLKRLMREIFGMSPTQYRATVRAGGSFTR